MRTITIVEDTELAQQEATISKGTWTYIEVSKGASDLAQQGTQIVVGELFEGPKYILKIMSDEHPENELRVSPWIKKTFYNCITSVSIY